MRFNLLGGVALLALATPLAAQTVTAPNGTSKIDAPLTDTNSKTTDVTGRSTPPSTATGSGIDSLVPADSGADVAATPAPPPPTGNPVLDRLNALEAKVTALETRNHELEAQAAEAQTRIQKVEVRAAKSVQFGVAPTFADVNDNFSFKPRGLMQLDFAAYREKAGGYDYNDGTDIRRGRFGFDGTAFKVFKYRIEAEFVKNTVNLLDAYVQYVATPKLVITAGQHKAPFGLEANSSDVFNEFMERSMSNNTFGAVGAERRMGISVAYQTDKLNAAVGVFGAGEGVQRSTNPTTPDETRGVNGRVTFDPVLDTGRLVHVGVSGYQVSSIGSKSLTLGDRPNTRVDNSLLESVVIGPVTTGPLAGRTRGAKSATFYGAESAVVFGPFSAQGEYGHLTVDRYGAVPDFHAKGYYGFASFFITGESRVFKNGVIDRLKPFNDFNPHNGHWGAFEIAARYDHLDLTDTNVVTPVAAATPQLATQLPHNATTYTGAINWYLNPNVKVLVNYVHFKGTNSPLAIAPFAVNGTTAKGDSIATRLQLDF